MSLVERNGMFWMEDLPLGAGMISIESTATDAAGNVNTTSFKVVQSGLTLDHLWTEDSGCRCEAIMKPNPISMNGVKEKKPSLKDLPPMPATIRLA